MAQFNRKYIQLLFFLLSVAIAEAQTTISQAEASIPILDFEVLKDGSMQVDIKAAIQSSDFKPVKKILQGELGATYWVKFQLENQDTINLDYLLEVSCIDFFEVQVYEVDSTNKYIGIDTLGSLQNFSERRIKSQLYNIPIHIKQQSTKSIYLYLDRRFLNFATTFTLYSPIRQLEREGIRNYTYGATTGITYFYLALAIMLFAFFRRWENFYFVLYVLGFACYLAYQHGLGLFYFWGEGSFKFLYDCSPYIGTVLALAGLLGVFCIFFDLKQTSPIMYRFFKSAQLFAYCLIIGFINWQILTQYFPKSYFWMTYSDALLYATTLPIMLVVGLRIYWKHRQLEHLLFLLTFLPAIVLTLSVWAMEMQLIDRKNWIYLNGPSALLFYEGFVLAIFLIYRVYRERVLYTKALAEERRVIIDDIHSGASISSLMEFNLQKIKPLHKTTAHELQKLLEEVQYDTRAFFWILHTDFQYLDRLIVKIRSKIQTRFAHTATKVSIRTEPKLLPEDIVLPFKIRYHLYLFIKEAVNNAAKYAQASHFNFDLKYEPGLLSIEMQDDGLGFDKTNTSSSSGHGLLELKRRADKMDAKYTIQTTLKKGTRIHLIVPIAYVQAIDAVVLENE